MALARLATKNLYTRLLSSSSYLCNRRAHGPNCYTFSSSTTDSDDKQVEGRQITVNEGGGKESSRSLRGNGGPFHLFPSGLLQVSENINRLFEKFNPSRLLGRVKERDDCYKLRYDVPGLAKEDLKVTVEDGVLTIRGEHKEEEEEGSASDDEYWSSSRYGFYNTSVLLPDDAKVDEVKAQLKDGVLSIIIPRTEKPNKDIREVEIQ